MILTFYNLVKQLCLPATNMLHCDVKYHFPKKGLEKDQG